MTGHESTFRGLNACHKRRVALGEFENRNQLATGRRAQLCRGPRRFKSLSRTAFLVEGDRAVATVATESRGLYVSTQVANTQSIILPKSSKKFVIPTARRRGGFVSFCVAARRLSASPATLIMLPDFTPLPRAALVVLLWLLTHLAATHKAIRIVGTVMDGGTPRWRSAVGLITQLGVLPVLFFVALISNGDAQGWSDRSAASRDGMHFMGWAFAAIFPSLMLLDFVLCELSPLIMAHHLVCVLGHVYACTVAARSFPAYFAGVVALEVGSGGTGVHCLSPKSFSAANMLVLMTISNLVALGCVWQWTSWNDERGWMESCTVVFTSSMLCLARQNDAQQVWRSSGVDEKNIKKI